MSEHLTLARSYLERAYWAEKHPHPEERSHNKYLRLMGHAILNYLEEAQQETPASAETTSSLQATAPTADGQSGSSTSFEWSCPAKAATGEPAITATVTFPVPNLLLTVGDLQRLVQEGNWIRLSPMTSEQLSRFGATPSTTPVEEVGGPSAGGAGPSLDSPASSPEPAQGGKFDHLCNEVGKLRNFSQVRCAREPGHEGHHWTQDGIMFASPPSQARPETTAYLLLRSRQDRMLGNGGHPR